MPEALQYGGVVGALIGATASALIATGQLDRIRLWHSRRELRRLQKVQGKLEAYVLALDDYRREIEADKFRPYPRMPVTPREIGLRRWIKLRLQLRQADEKVDRIVRKTDELRALEESRDHLKTRMAAARVELQRAAQDLEMWPSDEPFNLDDPDHVALLVDAARRQRSHGDPHV